MNLKERIANGMIFYEHGHISEEDQAIEKELEQQRIHCKEVLFDYNNTRPSDQKTRLSLLKGLLGKCGDNVFIEDGVHMSYGSHVFLEGAFYANFNLSIVDDGEIYIGDKTMIGPNVTICTTGHPVDPHFREMVAHFSLPIHIGRNVWIGSNAVILPGVTIGDNAVIGAGSIVSKDIPANVVALGNPCKVYREISERDKEYYFRDRKFDFPYSNNGNINWET